MNNNLKSLIFELPRPYKSCSPEETIWNIRNILYGLDLFVHETYWSNPYDGLFSVRIKLERGYGSFGTNGKGLSRSYSLASAYGEMLERIQNGVFLFTIPNSIFKYLKTTHGFYYFPDEIFLCEEEFRALPDSIKDDLFNFGEHQSALINGYIDYFKSKANGQCLGVPFTEWNSKNTINLPYNLLVSATGSNGMAAGNTFSEALTQALFEIFERWASSIIFHDHLCPPEVPASVLKKYDRQMAIIKLLEADGYVVSVRDFSAGIGLPCVGVLLVNPKNDSYLLNVGSDSVFEVALSRSLTELYQGVASKSEMESRLLPPPVKNPQFFFESSISSRYKREDEFAKFTENGQGRFPLNLFSNVPDYEYDNSAFSPKASFEEEISFCISLLTKHGYQTYVRDVSLFGFPSCHVYVPGVSTVGGYKPRVLNNCDFRQIADLEEAIETCMNWRTSSKEALKKAANCFSTLPPDLKIHKLFYLKVDPLTKFENLSVSRTEFSIWYYLEELTKAREAFLKFLNTGLDITEFDNCILRYLNLRIDGFQIECIPAALQNSGFGSYIAKDVHTMMKHPQDILNNIGLPSCPACKSCCWNENCQTKGYLALAEKLKIEKIINLR